MSHRFGLTTQHVVVLLALVGLGLVIGSSVALRFLRSPPDIAADAKEYLRAKDFKAIEASIDEVLAHPEETAPSLRHPLLNESAPSFELSDHNGKTHSIETHVKQGPVVVVFYYGYYCNHCVGQLFALNDDIEKFRELGAEIIAISPDAPEETAAKFAKYGMFKFPVLSDPDNRVASVYSVFAPKAEGKSGRQLHGTFVVDRDGIVRWAHYAHEPFTDNRTLLIEVAKAEGKLSSDQSATVTPES